MQVISTPSQEPWPEEALRKQAEAKVSEEGLDKSQGCHHLDTVRAGGRGGVVGGKEEADSVWCHFTLPTLGKLCESWLETRGSR